MEEKCPQNIPEPLDKEGVISTFVDANQTGNKITRRYQTGIIIYINNALIQVFYKRQNTVESINYGSELVAL